MQLDSPANGSTVDGKVTVSASASDPGSEILEVRFFLDGTRLATDTTAPYATTWNSRKSSRGQHNLYAVAVDRAGNPATSQTISVTR